jgi:hypothetical protein
VKLRAKPSPVGVVQVGSVWWVSVEFLSDEQASVFGRFVGEPSCAELERFFYLDDADRV